MGVFPRLDIDVASTVEKFLALLRSIDSKLDELIRIQSQRDERGCGACRKGLDNAD